MMPTNTNNPQVETIISDAVARVEQLHNPSPRKAPDPPTGSAYETHYKQTEEMRRSRKAGILFAMEELELRANKEFPELEPLWAEARKLRG